MKKSGAYSELGVNNVALDRGRRSFEAQCLLGKIR